MLRAKGDYELVDDRTPFMVRVEEALREDGNVIGVAGPVTAGDRRYTEMIATLLTRLDDSDWESEVHSAANFRVGLRRAHRIAGFPHSHPEGTAIDGYPQIVRYGRIDELD